MNFIDHFIMHCSLRPPSCISQRGGGRPRAVRGSILLSPWLAVCSAPVTMAPRVSRACLVPPVALEQEVVRAGSRAQPNTGQIPATDVPAGASGQRSSVRLEPGL